MEPFDLRSRCHVAENGEGDRFVGIRADEGQVEVCFPLGYQLPAEDKALRRDITNLIRVLGEFCGSRDRALSAPWSAGQRQAFPVGACLYLIRSFLDSGGRYYMEETPCYRTGTRGRTSWSRTFREQQPLVREDGALIYTQRTIRTTAPNTRKWITRIHKFCVYESFLRLGWLYVSYLPQRPEGTVPIPMAISILTDKLANTNRDREKQLFRAMLELLRGLDADARPMVFSYGTDHFETVWERMIDRAFGVRNKADFFPRARWILDFGSSRCLHPLEPDTIMIYRDKYYVLDAKYYRYGWTGNPAHLPDASSINKQITYGEYVHRRLGLDGDSLFNAFLMPYNMADNPFGLTGEVGSVGEAVGEWKENRLPYERIQGILVDTRYLMHHYALGPDRALLAAAIEGVLDRKIVK